MAESNGAVKCIMIVKFKDGLSEEQLDDYIKRIANLVNLVPSLKAFSWGKDVSVEHLHLGFTHVFDYTFESIQGISEFAAHPNHVGVGKIIMPQLEKFILVDIKPTEVQL